MPKGCIQQQLTSKETNSKGVMMVLMVISDHAGEIHPDHAGETHK